MKRLRKILGLDTRYRVNIFVSISIENEWDSYTQTHRFALFIIWVQTENGLNAAYFKFEMRSSKDRRNMLESFFFLLSGIKMPYQYIYIDFHKGVMWRLIHIRGTSLLRSASTVCIFRSFFSFDSVFLLLSGRFVLLLIFIYKLIFIWRQI